MMGTYLRRFGVLAGWLALGLLPHAGSAADTYDIPMIVSLTGPGTFIGTQQLRAARAAETVINRSGGIGGKPVRFVPQDDQSNPQVAVQLARSMIAAHLPLILGPSTTASCNAVAPLLGPNGPVLYCLTPGAHPTPGGFAFTNLATTPDSIVVAMRYFHARGWNKVATIVTTDATGQDAEQGTDAAVAAAGGMTIVDREHFGVTDLSATAQIARIKAASPDVVVAWANGASAGTVLHAVREVGLNVPILMSAADMTPTFVKQFGELFPPAAYFAVMQYYAPSQATPATRTAIDALDEAARAAGVQPDQVFVSTWDPVMLIADALRKLGPDVTAPRLHDDLAAVKGWVGACGTYDFRAFPQRGLGPASVVMVRWAPAEGTKFVPVSRAGGAPLGSR